MTYDYNDHSSKFLSTVSACIHVYRDGRKHRETISFMARNDIQSSLSQNVNALGYRIDMSTGLLMWYVKGMCTNVLILDKGSVR